MKGRALKVIKCLITILIIGVCYGIFVIKTGLGIPCIFKLITGFKCPGCGITTMFTHLMQLDFLKAFESNKMLFILLPILLLVFNKYIYIFIKTGKRELSKGQSVVINISLVLLIAFGILRNI